MTWADFKWWWRWKWLTKEQRAFLKTWLTWFQMAEVLAAWGRYCDKSEKSYRELAACLVLSYPGTSTVSSRSMRIPFTQGDPNAR